MRNFKLTLGSIIFMSAIMLIPIMANQSAYATTSTNAGDIQSPSKTVDFSQFTGDFGDLCVNGSYRGPGGFNWCFTNGPEEIGQLVGESVVLTSTNDVALGNSNYGLGGNGNWNSGRDGYVGLDTNVGTMRFEFQCAPVSAIGGFVNYAPGFGTPFTMKVLDNSNNVLETFVVAQDAPINTSGSNQGEFRGIIRAVDEIAALELSGEYDVLDDLKFTRINQGGECGFPDQVEVKTGGGDNQWDTRPTFGISHETRQDQIVENGFSFNTEYFTLTDNHHTDFAEQSVEIGAMNSFSATVYADKKLKIQEFLFGIPNVGESHLAELGIEVWYDTDGEIEDVIVVQKSDVIDADTVSVSHEKTKCLSNDPGVARCDTTTVSMTFLEPLADKVMAIKAIDYALRDQRTFLNEGFDISGESLNPMLKKMIPSAMKNEGLVTVTQVAKYSPFWTTDDGRMFEMNSFGSFKQINQSFERFQDTGNAFTRAHSGFGGIISYEQDRATQIFDSTKLISELPDSFGHHFEIDNRVNEELMQEMLLQAEIAQSILDEMDRQDRHY